MTEGAWITFGAAAYILVIVAVSVAASRKVHDSTDFVVAGRRLPLWLCIFTVFATWFGSGTLIGAAGAAYGGGLRSVIANPFGSALCLLLAGLFYVRFLRRLRLLTLPDLFARRYGRPAEVLCAICVIPAYIGWVASIFVAFGTVLHALVGIELASGIWIGAVITIGYTVAGGMWAVSLTDFLQAILIVAGLLLLMPSVLADIGGWQGLTASAPAGHLRFFPAASALDWIFWIQSLLVIGLGNIASQDLLQRAFAARSEAVAQWSMYLAGLLYITIALIPVFIGIAGAALMPTLARPELVLPLMGKAYLHPVAMAVFAGALFAALMSSADGGLLAPASIIGRNLAPRRRHERATLVTMRGAVVAVGIFSLITALLFQNVYQLMVKSFSVLMVGLFVPMTAAIYWPKANAPSAIAAIISGVLGWLGFEVLRATHGIDLPGELLAAAISAVTMGLVAIVTQQRVAPIPATDVDGRPVPLQDRLGLLRRLR